MFVPLYRAGVGEVCAGGIGLSNVDVEQLSQARPAGIACVQNAHSLLDRSSEPLLGLCRENGIAIR